MIPIKSFLLSPMILVLALFLMIDFSLMSQDVEIKPLFPVTLEDDFQNPAETFEEVKQLMLDHYYSPELSEDVLYYAAIEGMLRRLSPPDNPELGKIWTEKDYGQVEDSLKGVRVSVGIKSSFDANDGSLTVTEVTEGSPAQGQLQVYDRILRIDDEPLKGLSVKAVNELLYGEEGSEVILTVNRDIKIFDVALVRRELETKNLFVTRLTLDIAYVELKKFSSGISEKLKMELQPLVEEGLKAIILDMRDNTGGVFSEALKTAELFIHEKGIILRTYDKEKKLQNYISSNPDYFDLKIAVLTNGNTASAAEIVSSALQDHQKGPVIGIKSYGKGVFERTFELENNYRVKFITGAMYTPKGKAWQNKGIIPDFLVEQSSARLKELKKQTPSERLKTDIGLITAFKLLKGE